MVDILKSTRLPTGSQCCWRRAGVMCSHRLTPVMRRACALTVHALRTLRAPGISLGRRRQTVVRRQRHGMGSAQQPTDSGWRRLSVEVSAQVYTLLTSWRWVNWSTQLSWWVAVHAAPLQQEPSRVLHPQEKIMAMHFSCPKKLTFLVVALKNKLNY